MSSTKKYIVRILPALTPFLIFSSLIGFLAFLEYSRSANHLRIAGQGYYNIRPDELDSMLTNKDFTFIDVHTPEQEHIPGTDLVIPYDQLGEHVRQLPKSRTAKIVLYCRSGHMSEIAAKELAQRGYANVYNVLGGKNAYDTYRIANGMADKK